MTNRNSHVNVFVLDREQAKAFYTDKLGFEVRSDITMDGFRWLTVGPKAHTDLNILLAEPKPPIFSQDYATRSAVLSPRGPWLAASSIRMTVVARMQN